MDIKPGICQACCSHDRQLHSLEEVRPLILTTNISQLRLVDGEICWECKSLIQKFTNFLSQVEKAQETIALGNQLCLSRLSTNINRGFDAEYFYDLIDPLNVVEPDVKEYEIKLEDDCSGDENKAFHSEDGSDFDEPLAYLERRNESDIKSELRSEDKQEDNAVTEITKGHQETHDGKIKSEFYKKKHKRAVNIEKLSASSTKYENKASSKYYELIKISDEDIKLKMENKRNNSMYKRQPFKCDLCVLGFRVERLFLQHMVKHDEKSGDHQCDICLLRFTSRPLLTIHKDKHLSFLRCKVCKFETGNLKYIVYHIKEKHGDCVKNNMFCIKCGGDCGFSCNECHLQFATSEDFQEHNDFTHRGKLKLHCKICYKLPKRLHSDNHSRGRSGVKRRKKRSRVENDIDVDNKDHISDNNITNSEERLQLEELNHSDAGSGIEERTYSEECSLPKEEKFTCNECGMSFKLKTALIAHTKFKHKEKSKSKEKSNVGHLCQECGKTFSLEKYLRGHILFVHRRESKFKCETCNKIFYRGCKLKIHMQIHHGLERSRNCICDVCGKAFYNTNDLTHHLLVHSEERKYKCNECGAAFKQTGSLSHHMKWKHKGVVANSCHVCQECGKTFGHERWLNDHIEFVHRRQSKYKCESCDKIFSRAWNLLMHNQTNHSIDRPRNFSCDVCGRKFYRNEDMKKHQLIHSEERKYKCKECGATFKQTGSLCNHIKSKHKGIKLKSGQTFKFE